MSKINFNELDAHGRRNKPPADFLNKLDSARQTEAVRFLNQARLRGEEIADDQCPELRAAPPNPGPTIMPPL